MLLLAGISFVNYVLWKIYGAQGVELTGFLGGLVNSTVTVGEMAAKVKEPTAAWPTGRPGHHARHRRHAGAQRGLLSLLAPALVASALLPLGLMLGASVGASWPGTGIARPKPGRAWSSAPRSPCWRPCVSA